MKLRRKWLPVLLLCALCLPLGGLRQVRAAETLFELKSSKEIMPGVIYNLEQQVTVDGLLDVHVLQVPLDDPGISVGPAETKKEYGLKETVANLLAADGAVAGVNGDFFGMSGNYSAAFGPVFKDGELISVSTGFNKENNDYASFYINDENNAFILYVKPEIHFYNNGDECIQVYSINKVTDMVFPIIVNRRAMNDTKDLDRRFEGLLKVVVDNDMVTYVSQKGETVEVPENGYVLVISEASADYFGPFYKAGQTAKLTITAGMNYDKVVSAIGGAGRILLNGEVVHDGGMIITGRHPRTAVGISADQKTLTLMVVDGRTHSIGATHEELGALLKKYGAYNAMHLDGGGSSTMAVRKEDRSGFEVVNTVSDGSQRKVMNALAIYDTSKVGPMEKLLIKAEAETAFQGVPIKVNVYGADHYNHTIDIPRGEVVVNSDDPNGRWMEEYYYPGRTGQINFIAAYNQYTGEGSIEVKQLVELTPNTKSINIMEGEKKSLSFTGTDTEGIQKYVPSGVSYEIVPPELGHMDYGTFVADKAGSGYIKASVGEIPTYIEVHIGGKSVPLYSFERERQLTFAGYPANVTGEAGYTGDRYVDGSASAQLTYAFSQSDATQAAYLVFAEPMGVQGSPIALKLSVYGNQSGLLLKGRITDADGKEHTIDFTGSIDWDGWRALQAMIPSGVKYPVKLDRIYTAALTSGGETTGTLYFDSLQAVYPLDAAAVKLPEAPKYKDPFRVTLSGSPAAGSFDLTMLGNTNVDGDKKPDGYAAVQSKVLAVFTKNTTRALYAGASDWPLDINAKVYKWNTGYVMHKQDNVAILQMSAEKGGLLNTNREQWAKFRTDIESSGANHVIIELDRNPYNFEQRQEFELFHKQLVRFREAGKTVFVVSTQGSTTTDQVRDGVRYINLGRLFAADGSVNPSFRLLRLRVTAGAIQYDLQKLE